MSPCSSRCLGPYFISRTKCRHVNLSLEIEVPRKEFVKQEYKIVIINLNINTCDSIEIVSVHSQLHENIKCKYVLG